MLRLQTLLYISYFSDETHLYLNKNLNVTSYVKVINYVRTWLYDTITLFVISRHVAKAQRLLGWWFAISRKLPKSRACDWNAEKHSCFKGYKSVKRPVSRSFHPLEINPWRFPSLREIPGKETQMVLYARYNVNLEYTL